MRLERGASFAVHARVFPEVGKEKRERGKGKGENFLLRVCACFPVSGTIECHSTRDSLHGSK